MSFFDILYAPNSINVQVFRIFNNVHNDIYHNIMRIGTKLGEQNYFVFLFPIIVAIFFIQLRNARTGSSDFGDLRLRRVQAIAVLLIAFLIQVFVIQFLKTYFSIPRPFIALPDVLKIIDESPPPYQSFPSGHGAYATLICTALWPTLSRYTRVLAVFYVLWVMVSRMALGVHSPADLLAGGAIAFIITWLVRFFVVFFMRNKTIK